MKKYLVIILCALIGVFIYLEIPKPESINKEVAYTNPLVSISIERVDEYGLDYADISKILSLCGELGFTNVKINDFRWEFYWIERWEIPQSKNEEPIILKRRDVDIDKSSDYPLPKEQYDLNAIEDWCKLHSGKDAYIYFGDEVPFNVIEIISQIFYKHHVPYFLRSPIDEDGRMDIEIGLFQHRNPKEIIEPNQALQPTPLDASDKVKAQGGAAEL